MAAGIAYLLEWQWNVQQLTRWHRPASQFLLEAEISIQDPWWKLERALLQEATAQRTARFASKENHHHLVTGIDWHTYQTVLKELPRDHKTYLRTWTQGGIHYKEAGKPKQCPICNVPATAKHILWLRKWHQTQHHQPMPSEWAERILTDDETPLWSAGWLPLEPQEHKHIRHPYQGHGAWRELAPLATHQYQGWAFTLDATPTSYDARDQIWVFGLCVHSLSMGQLQRLGAITGTTVTPHTKARALMEGLVALTKHTTTTVRVIVQLVSVWEAWTHPKHRGPFLDILEQVTDQDFNRVTVLYVSRNTRSPEAPGSEPQLRRRQRDAALTAWERAKEFQSSKRTEWQHVVDEDAKLIYQHAIERLAKIYKDKDHYLHQKPDRHQGKHTKQYKKQLIGRCNKPWLTPLHRWAPHRSGYQCGACGIRVHQALTVVVIEERLQEPCPQLSIEENIAEPASPHVPMPKKKTRQQVIQQLLQQQQAQAVEQTQHELEETTGYLRCVKCGTSIHKRSNETTFQSFLTSSCLDQPCPHSHDGHQSHALWQKGSKVTCTQCGLSLHLDGQQRVILTASIKRPCKGAASAGTPPLTDFFARQTGGENTHTQQRAAPLTEGGNHPTPRRLHFATPLTQAEDQRHPALAMNPSLDAGQHQSPKSTARPEGPEPASQAYASETLHESTTRLRATGHETQPHRPQQPHNPTQRQSPQIDEHEDSIEVDFF